MRLPKHPLPKRGKREAILRRTATLIPTQEHLDIVLASQQPATRKAWFEALAPHLKFDARPLA